MSSSLHEQKQPTEHEHDGADEAHATQNRTDDVAVYRLDHVPRILRFFARRCDFPLVAKRATAP
jgi:hypothetical protein